MEDEKHNTNFYGKELHTHHGLFLRGKHLFRLLLFIGLLGFSQKNYALDYIFTEYDGICIRYDILSEDEKTVSVEGVGEKQGMRIEIPGIVSHNNKNYTVTEIGQNAFVVEGAADALVEVYGLNGGVVYRGYEAVVDGLPKGVYVVRVGECTRKVIL